MADVRDQLDALRRLWVLYVVGGGVCRWLGWVGVTLAAALLVSQVSPWLVRSALLIGWIGAVCALAYTEWVRSAWRVPTRDDMAARVEDAHPGARQRILAALQLDERQEQARRLLYDPALVELSVQGGIGALGGTSPQNALAGERRGALSGLAFAAVSGLLLVLLYASGLISVSAWRDWVRAPSASVIVRIERVDPGDVRVHLGQDVDVSAEVTGAGSDGVQLEMREDVGPWQRVTMSGGDGTYRASIDGVVAPMDYRVVAGKLASEAFHVDVAIPPGIDSLSIQLDFPAYTGLDPKTLPENQGDVTALVGTTVRLSGSSTVPLEAGQLDFEAMDDVALTIQGEAFNGKFVLKESGRYTVALTSADGLAAEYPPQFIVYAIEDAPPSVAVLRPGANTDLDKTMTVPLELEVIDDFSVSRVLLRYRIEETGEEGTIRLRDYREATPLARFEYVWDLTEEDLFPRDEVSYYIEGFDNDTVSGPKRAVSPTYTVRFPSLSEMLAEARARDNAQTEMLGSMLDAQEESTGIVDALIDRMRREHELTLQDHQELERATELQEDVRERSEQVAQEVLKSLREAEQNSLLSLETLQKVAEMQKLLDEVMSQEASEALRKLQEALRETSPDRQQQQLMEANFRQEEFEDRIEQMIAMLDNMKRRQELEKALRLSEDLVRRQEQVVEGTEEATQRSDDVDQATSSELERLSKQEETIRNQSEGLDSQMRTAEEALREDEQLARIADEVARLRQEMQTGGLEEQLRRAGELLSQQDAAGAQPPATTALQQLREVEQGLDQALEAMRGADGAALMKALRNASEEVLHLSALQEEIFGRAADLGSTRGDSSPLGAARLGELAVEQLVVADGVDSVAAALESLSEDDAQMPLELMWEVRAAQDALRRSSTALADGEAQRARPIQREALGDLNEVALRMLDAMEEMQQQMGSSGLQNALEQLQQLAEGQGDLNDLAEQLNQMLRERGRSPSADQTLERMAFEQSLIRRAFGELEERLEQIQQMLGGTEGIGSEMEDVEERLHASELDREVLERMRRIETRMLESSKSLQKRQTGRSRKAAVAERLYGEQAGTDTSALESVREAMRHELERLGEMETPEAYSELIRSYYRAIAERGERPGE